MDIMDEILEISKANPDGFTINLKTMSHVRSGYAVAYIATQNSFGTEGLETVINHAKDHDNIVGGWKDEDDYYFDSVMVVDDLEEALRLGKENLQKAICDLKRKRVIMIK